MVTKQWSRRVSQKGLSMLFVRCVIQLVNRPTDNTSLRVSSPYR